jgi:hypothetical protein
MRSPLLALPCSLLLVGAFLGCSGGVAGAPGDTTDGGGNDGDGGAIIWPSDAKSLAADSPGGGFTPTPPAGSTCAFGEQHYKVDLETRAFSSERCTPGAAQGDPLQIEKISRTLTPAELATVDTAMRQLTPPKNLENCGADKGVYTVTVSTPRGDTTYYDSIYACQGGGKTYVDQIDGVFEAFGKLAPAK